MLAEPELRFKFWISELFILNYKQISVSHYSKPGSLLNLGYSVIGGLSRNVLRLVSTCLGSLNCIHEV